MDHPKFVWLDGKLTPWEEATIHVTQIGPASVSSVFEGIRAYWNDSDGKLYIFRLDTHLDRFAQSMRLMRMKQTFSNQEIRDGILELLRANQPAGDIYIRPVAFVPAALLGSASSNEPSVAVNTQEWPSSLKNGRVAHACISSWTRISDNVIPPRVKASSNYLNSRLATEEAKRNGYDSAILLNPQGKVAEAPSACLMIVRNGVVITPTVTSGILESITRETLIHLCREVLQVSVIEREVDRTELYIANEVFLCGTGHEITPIVSVDRLPVGTGQVGPLTRRVEDLYCDVVRGVDKRYPEWRTRV